MSSTLWIILIVGLIAAVWWWEYDEPAESYKPCPEYGCPSAKGSDKSIPPRGNVVLNEFYYPYSGAPYFEHDANDVTMQPEGPAFVAGNPLTSGGVENMGGRPLSASVGQHIAAKSEPDHVEPSS